MLVCDFSCARARSTPFL
uniref:Uncharacterized protein n=1 Tax=Anguilla anguilla TaxID=7936 RepID=A0A0E9Y2R7_ANGAN